MSRIGILAVTNETGKRLPPGARQAMQSAAAAAVAAGSCLAPARVRVDFTLVSDERLRELSREYLGADHYTDVMAFSLLDEPAGSALDRDSASGPGPGPVLTGGPRRQLLGDVVVSRDRAAAQAQEFGHPLATELALLAAHGVLHLLGHDDSTPESAAAMRKLEARALAAAGLRLAGSDPGAGAHD